MRARSGATLKTSIGLVAVGGLRTRCYIRNRVSLAESAMVGTDFPAIMCNGALADRFHGFARSKRKRAVDHHRRGCLELFRCHKLRFAHSLGTTGRESHHPQSNDHIGFKSETRKIEEHREWCWLHV